LQTPGAKEGYTSGENFSLNLLFPCSKLSQGAGQLMAKYVPRFMTLQENARL
jgi:hypothetical protein